MLKLPPYPRVVSEYRQSSRWGENAVKRKISTVERLCAVVVCAAVAAVKGQAIFYKSHNIL